jgi:talin
VVGKAGIIDQKEVSDAIAGIQEASRAITTSAPVSQQQVLGAATVIAKYSHTLCSSCRNASSRSSNPVAKRQFVQSAKDIATSTANLVRAVKTLDNNFSDSNRQECITHINTLLRSVNDLGVYASSPEFASSAGQLSSGGRKVQEPIVVSSKCIIDASSSLILAAKSLSVNSRDPAAWQALTSQSTNVSDSVKSLATAIKDKAPGQVECNEAIDRLQNYLRIVNKTSLAATSQQLPQRNENTTEGFYEVTINTSIQLTQTITRVRDSARSEAESLGHRVSQMSSYFQSLVQDGIGAASRAPGSRDQMAILNHLKTVLESSIQFVEISKACGGNPRTRNLHGDLNESADSLLEAMHELRHTLERIQSESGFVRTMINNVSSAISKVDQRISGGEESFADYQTRMFRVTKEITRITHEMNAKSQSDPQELGNLAQQLYNNYNQLAEDSRGAQGSCASNEISQRIRTSVQELGHAAIDLIKVAGSVQSNPSDTYIKDELSRSSKLVIEKVSYVLSALQSGSRGTQACINAASTVSGVIGDLDTTIMFATAGTLQAEDENDRFSDHRLQSH